MTAKKRTPNKQKRAKRKASEWRSRRQRASAKSMNVLMELIERDTRLRFFLLEKGIKPREFFSSLANSFLWNKEIVKRLASGGLTGDQLFALCLKKGIIENISRAPSLEEKLKKKEASLVYTVRKLCNFGILTRVGNPNIERNAAIFTLSPLGAKLVPFVCELYGKPKINVNSILVPQMPRLQEKQFKVLTAIAKGARTRKEIARRAGITSASAAKITITLSKAGLIKGEKEGLKSRGWIRTFSITPYKGRLFLEREARARGLKSILGKKLKPLKPVRVDVERAFRKPLLFEMALMRSFSPKLNAKEKEEARNQRRKARLHESTLLERFGLGKDFSLKEINEARVYSAVFEANKGDREKARSNIQFINKRLDELQETSNYRALSARELRERAFLVIAEKALKRVLH